MKVILVVSDGSAETRRLVRALLSAGYGVTETLRADLIPLCAHIDCVVGPVGATPALDAPVVRMERPLALESIVAAVRAAVSHAEERAA